MSTSFSTKCEILAEVYVEATWNSQLFEFAEQQDIGLPLGYMIHKEIATATPSGTWYIDSTWKDLCELLKVDSEAEYTSAEEILKASEKNTKKEE